MSTILGRCCFTLPLCAALFVGAVSLAQSADRPGGSRQAAIGDPGTVVDKISLNDAIEPFERTLGEHDEFGSALASLGDINGDGFREFAIGAPGDAQDRGAVWIFSLTSDRRVRKFVKLGPVESLPFTLDLGDRFGTSVTALGDLDGDGVGEVAVGAPGDDDGLVPPFINAGAVYVLFLRASGTIKEVLKISRATGFPGVLSAGDRFGSSVATLGDVDGNGVADLAVGAPGDNEGDVDAGSLWVLLFAADRSILSVTKISATQGGLVGPLVASDRFGSALAALGDLGGDGKPELAVGAPGTSTIFVLSLASDGSVAAETRFGVFNGGGALASLGDLDGDGVTDLAVGTPKSSACDVLTLLSSGLPKTTAIVPAPVSGSFGAAVAAAGDADGDGHADLVVGAPLDDTRVTDSGAIVFFNLSTGGAALGAPVVFDAATSGLPIAPKFFANEDNRYGQAVATLGDLNGDGFPEVAVGDPTDDDGVPNAGAVWIHYLTATAGTRVAKISRTQTSIPLGPDFGQSVAGLGDLDGDGTPDLAVGSLGNQVGAKIVWVIFLRSNGDVASFQQIASTLGGFGRGLASLGDLDGDGATDLAVSANGRVLVYFLNPDGTVKDQKELQSGPTVSFGDSLASLGQASGSSHRYLAASDGSKLWRLELDPQGEVVNAVNRTQRNRSLASIGDLDGDGVGDMAVLRPNGVNARLELQFLRANWSVASLATIPAGLAFSLSTLGDLSGDGVFDLAGAVRTGHGSRVVLWQLGGVATRDFELQDDARLQRLENGRSIPSPYVGRTLTVSSSGPNRGAAIFDSNPSGPNQGDDLCIGHGNVVILQDDQAASQSAPGIFAHPQSDPDGGVLAFDFPRPVEARALTLADLDPPPNRGAVVTLFDAQSRTRTFTVPPGWTGGYGVPGARRLDLTTLLPQPGANGRNVFTTQAPGFAAQGVVRLEVELFTGGAIDDLVYDPYP